MGLEVNVDKTKYRVKFREQSARVNQKIDNITFEKVELFKNLGTILTNQISIQEELKVN
jgi:hypothetical protein